MVDDKINEAMQKVKDKKLRENLNLTSQEFTEFVETRDEYNPTLFDVHNFLGKNVVGEHETRMSIFTTFVLSGISTYVSGLSSAGKTTVLDAVCDTMMPGDSLVINDTSDKAIFDMTKQIDKCTHISFIEINKVNPVLIEIVKSFAEGKSYEYQRARITGGGNQIITLEPRVIAFTRASESERTFPIGVELLSRMVEIGVDGSEVQTKDILHRKAKGFENPFSVKKINTIDSARLKWHVSNIPKFDYVINAGASSLIKFIPTQFVTSRRDYTKYINNIDGITKFYHKNRMTCTIQGKSVVFTTLEDIFLNHFIFGETLIRSAIKCSEMEQEILGAISGSSGMMKNQVQRQLQELSNNVTLSTIDTHLKHLEDIGYLDAERVGRSNVYHVSDFYRSFDVNPDFEYIRKCIIKTLKDTSIYGDIVDEYVKRFCSDDAMVIKNPFTNADINMLTYEFDKLINDAQVSPQRTWSEF